MFITILIISFCISFDALAVGVSYGVKNIKISYFSQVLISVLSFIYTFIAIWIGQKLSMFFSDSISSIVSSVLFFLIALLMLWRFLSEKSDANPRPSKSPEGPLHVIKCPDESDLDNSGTIDFKESFLLSIALSIDCISAALGISMHNLYSIFLPILAGMFQFIFMRSGQFLGKILVSKLSNLHKISLIPCILLFIIAILKLFFKKL